MWKASGFVNAGTAVTLGDIQVQMASSDNRSLQIKTTGTNFTGEVSANLTYNSNQFTYFAGNTITVSGTMGYLQAAWSLPTDGDLAVYYLRDTTNLRFWRITLMVGSGYNNNMISIERLY